MILILKLGRQSVSAAQNSGSIEDVDEGWPESLIIATTVPTIEKESWEFAHPTKMYHGGNACSQSATCLFSRLEFYKNKK